MTCSPLLTLILLVSLAAANVGCAQHLNPLASSMPWKNRSAAALQPGTPEWWKQNRSRAKLVQGGYAVAGVNGLFDGNGRPIDAPLDEETLAANWDQSKPKETLLDDVVPWRRYTQAPRIAQAKAKASRAKSSTQLQQANQLYAEGKYAQAAGIYRSLTKNPPTAIIEQQALYQLGNCYLFQDEYVDARDTFVELVEKYPNFTSVDDAVEKLWKIGQYWEQQYWSHPSPALAPNLVDSTRPWFDTLGHAVKTYENIQLYDPTGPRADDAIMAIAGIHFRRGRYGDADFYYKTLRENYPNSDFQFEAHLLGLQSKLRKYQGPDYDGSTLDEAQKLASQIRAQFSRHLTDEEHQRLRETQAEVIRQIAQRDLNMAEFYANTEHYQAAQVYYSEVLQQHPDTAVAQEAQARLSQLQQYPSAPPRTSLAWLVDLFPENSERTRVARVPELADTPTRVAQKEQPDGVQPASATIETRR